MSYSPDEIRKFIDGPSDCFCVGPQDGNPVCPCRMRYVTIRNGRYVEEVDHGPARDLGEVHGQRERQLLSEVKS